MLDVPGMSSTFGERGSQAREICCVVAPCRAATASTAAARTGAKPPTGKYGTKAIPGSVQRSSRASSSRWTSAGSSAAVASPPGPRGPNSGAPRAPGC